MNNILKITAVALLLVLNGIFACYMSREIRAGNIPWYVTYVTSLISASIFAYQLKAKILPLTVMSVFQTFFFHASWYITAYFILENELRGHKIAGLFLAFVGMILMSI